MSHVWVQQRNEASRFLVGVDAEAAECQRAQEEATAPGGPIS